MRRPSSSRLYHLVSKNCASLLARGFLNALCPYQCAGEEGCFHKPKEEARQQSSDKAETQLDWENADHFAILFRNAFHPMTNQKVAGSNFFTHLSGRISSPRSSCKWVSRERVGLYGLGTYSYKPPERCLHRIRQVLTMVSVW